MATSTQVAARYDDIAREMRLQRIALDNVELADAMGIGSHVKNIRRARQLQRRLVELSEELWGLGQESIAQQGL